MNFRGQFFFWSLLPPVAKVHPKYLKCCGVWNANTRIAFLIVDAFIVITFLCDIHRPSVHLFKCYKNTLVPFKRGWYNVKTSNIEQFIPHCKNGGPRDFDSKGLNKFSHFLSTFGNILVKHSVTAQKKYIFLHSDTFPMSSYSPSYFVPDLGRNSQVMMSWCYRSDEFQGKAILQQLIFILLLALHGDRILFYTNFTLYQIFYHVYSIIRNVWHHKL